MAESQALRFIRLLDICTHTGDLQLVRRCLRYAPTTLTDSLPELFRITLKKSYDDAMRNREGSLQTHYNNSESVVNLFGFIAHALKEQAIFAKGQFSFLSRLLDPHIELRRCGPKHCICTEFADSLANFLR